VPLVFLIGAGRSAGSSPGKTGQRVLIHGGAGDVGPAMQIARALGTDVFAKTHGAVETGKTRIKVVIDIV
jgi:NADPH:quinone reductase-like Zn-dependent oxidoreductase